MRKCENGEMGEWERAGFYHGKHGRLRRDTRKLTARQNRLTPIETRQFAPGLKFAR